MAYRGSGKGRRDVARRAMATPSPQAGGFWLVLAIIAGTVIGLSVGQPSAGILIGAAIGVVAVLILYVVDRNRTKSAGDDVN
jgi:UDP-N-acetylmuramyl pentapeptide phosphotransferase/UDP-N-acetylglucosamine-1-phosphate transferase